MANNVITATYSSSNITYTKPAYQYDYGMILKFSGIELPQAYEVHFSNTEFCGESISQIGDENGVTIPDEMFLSGAPIYAWTFLHTGEDDGETVYKAVISVNKRAKPSDLEPTPVQQDAITQAIAALNVAVEQTAQDVISAGESAQAASDAADVAVEAKDQAIDAKESAEDAQEAAETAQGKAEDAQQAAEQAAGSVLGLTAEASVDANTGTPSVEVDVTTEADHKHMEFTFRNLKGVQGDQGVGISSVILNADYTLTITLTNGASYTTSSIRGEVGATPNLTIGTVATLPEGSQATATITGTDEEPVLNLGIPVGDTGATGNGIASIAKTGAVGLVDTYTITYTDGTTSTFEVTNGADGEVSEEELTEKLADKADVITSSASGEIVTIADGADNLPVKNLSVSLLPVQNLNGQDAPYPPGGGTNLLPMPITSGSYAYTAVITVNDDLSFYITKTSASGWASFILGEFTLKAGTYTLIESDDGSGNATVAIANIGTGSEIANTRYSKRKTFTLEEDTEVRVTYSRSAQASNVLTKLMLFSGDTATADDYAPYSNVCPISGWTGVEVYHSDEDTSNPTTYPISWQSTAGTVYGGTVNPVTGLLNDEYDWAIADANGNLLHRGGSALSGSGYRSGGYVIYVVGQRGDVVWKSNVCNIYKTGTAIDDDGSCYVYNSSSDARMTFRDTSIPRWAEATSNAALFSAFKTYVANQYALGNVLFATWKVTNPITYQLDPVQIQTLLGTNNFWSNSNGSIDLEYRCDTKLYIENLTKPTEDDMTANQNITASSFFMVGNRLFLSTVAIAQGATIIPGTNCTEISLADALNSLNS